jgi:hypothetical protein
MANPRTRDVHWRLDPEVVKALEEVASQNGTSVSYAANYLLANSVRPDLPAAERPVPSEQN